MAETMNSDLFTTLDQAREWHSEAIQQPKGSICPCCQRYDKVYRRRFSNASIRILFRIYQLAHQHTQIEYFHTSNFSEINSHEWSKFKHLDLIKEAVNDDTNKKTSARWKITNKGRSFCRGIAAIPEGIILYHDEMIGVFPDNKVIHEFWPEFNYRELMSA